MPVFANAKRIFFSIIDLSYAALKINQNIHFVKETKPVLFSITLLSSIE
jgi:hypothetical protein